MPAPAATFTVRHVQLARAALTARLISVLVTDDTTARSLLEP